MSCNNYQDIIMNETTTTQVLEQQETCLCSLSTLICLCFFIGVYKIWTFLQTLLGSYFRKRLDLVTRYGGGWALITGGSEGIGEAIALELAKSGFNLILVSRSMQKLNKAKEGILALTPNIEVEVYSMDFSTMVNQKQYESAFGEIFKKDISLLVNNVGYYAPDFFLNIPYKTIRTEAKLNLIPIAALTSMFLSKTNRRQGKSGLINLSSAAAMIVYEGTAHYSATKTYDDVFSEAINMEVNSKVDVLTVRPFYVSTPMTRNTVSATHALASQTAKEAVDSLGRVDICYGPFTHRLNAALINLVHQKVTTFSASKSLKDFKKSYYKKEE